MRRYRLRLRTQLLGLAALPLAGFLLLAVWVLGDAVDTVTHTRDVGAQVRQLATYDQLISVLQVERGRSNGWLGAVQTGSAQTDQLKAALMQARRQSDQLLGEAVLADETELRDQLQKLRGAIDARQLAAGLLFDRYSGLIQSLMTRGSVLLRGLHAPQLADATLASLSLTSLMEETARERGLLNGMISAGVFGDGQRDLIVAAVARQSKDERQFLLFADPAIAERYQALNAVNPMRELLQMRKMALGGELAALDSLAWFRTATARIDSLQVLQRRQFDDITQQAGMLLEQAHLQLKWLSIAAGAALLLTLLLVLLISRSVVRSVGGEPHEVAEIARQIARGELGQTLPLRRGDRTSILVAMHQMAGTLSHLMGELQRRAAVLNMAANQLNQVSIEISHSSQQQASTIEETSAAMRTVSEASEQNNEHAMQTAQLAQKSSADAREGCMAVAFTVAAMRKVSVSVRHLDEIAYRTNLLALNAGIEAARAGMEGKGFAVIATEVRRLAEHAQQAAQDVSQITDQTLDTAEKTGEMLDGMLPSIISTAELVARISATSQQQARDMAQINTAVEHFSGALQYNADTAEHLFNAAQDMQRQAQGLQELVQFFHSAAERGAEVASEPLPALRRI